MEHQLTIYNTLSRTKEVFKPLHAPHVGMYVCGPTVYGDPHLGHARPAITFDILFRYLKHLGYKVRYVRNITDVGHLEHDADEGEDKIAKKARLEQLEPMEVAQYYANRYHEAMDALGVLRPSIEPQASGHIIEQIELVKEILKRSVTPPTSPCGRMHNRSTSCAGRRLGATVSRAGTANVRPWDGSIWANTSTYTEAAWTSSSRITNAR